MDSLQIAIVLIVLLCTFMAAGFLVALALLSVGVIAMLVFADAPAGAILPTTMWSASSSWTLTALPLFIWMGEILYRTKLAEHMFSGLSPWLNRIPGRLLHVNVLGCATFAAVSGSSSATTATIGRISLPELRSRGYDEKMAIGSLAGSGTLGLMIPPSIIMIVYGASAQVSIAKLFMAGILPGLLLVVLFSGYIGLWSRFNAQRMPAKEPGVTFGQRLWQSRLLIPVVALIVFVIGSIYTGVATPTESASLGVLGALLLAAAGRSLNTRMFMDSVQGAVRTTCMIAFILFGAAFMTSAMSFTGIPAALAETVQGMGLGRIELVLLLTLFFIALGCFLDGVSIVVLTSSILLPTIQAAGIDLIWFGIFLILVVEMAQITPPVGFNLFVIQGLVKKDIWFVTRASAPFFVLLVVAVCLLLAFPSIALYLPGAMTF